MFSKKPYLRACVSQRPKNSRSAGYLRGTRKSHIFSLAQRLLARRTLFSRQDQTLFPCADKARCCGSSARYRGVRLRGHTAVYPRAWLQRYRTRKAPRHAFERKTADSYARGGYKKLGERAKRISSIEERAADLFSLALPSIMPCGAEYTDGISVI